MNILHSIGYGLLAMVAFPALIAIVLDEYDDFKKVFWSVMLLSFNIGLAVFLLTL